MGRSTRAFIGALIAFGLWWMVVTGFDIRPLFLPGPDDVVLAFSGRASHLLEETGVTLAQTARAGRPSASCAYRGRCRRSSSA